MPSFEDLCARRSVTELIHVVEQVPARAAARMPMKLDDSSVALVTFWTLLRWERTFWVKSLEDRGLDLDALARDLDDLLRQTSGETEPDHPLPTPDSHSDRFQRQIDRFLDPLLDRAAREARAMSHGYLGCEHLLLALVAGAGGPLASLLLQHGVRYQEVKDAIRAALPDGVSTSENETEEPIDAILVEPVRRPWGARWDTTAATGVPRQFGLAVLFLMVTLYALLFSSMQLLGFGPVPFIVVAVLVTGVGLGQMLLFGGRHPRAASIWIGACLFPAEILIVNVGAWLLKPNATVSIDGVARGFAGVILSIPGGAFFGYLFGGLAAGVFLLLDRYAERKAAAVAPEDDSSEGLEEGPA